MSPPCHILIYTIYTLYCNSHGAASFQELAQIVSANWKTLDAESMAFVTSVSATLKAYVVANGLVLEGPNKPAKRKKKINNTTVNPSKKMRVDDGRNYLGGVLLNNNYPPFADMQPPNNMDMAVVAAALGNYQAILKNSTSSSLAAVAAAAANPRVNNNSSRTAKIRARADADHQNAADADSLESRSSNGGISRRYSRRVTDDTSPSPQGLTRSTTATTSAAATAKVDQSPMGRLLAVGSLALEHEVERGEAAAVAARNKAREEHEERDRQTRLLVQQELERRMALAQQVREIERELVIRQLQNQASMRFSSHQAAPSQQHVVHNGTDMSVMRMLENELARRRAAGQNNTR